MTFILGLSLGGAALLWLIWSAPYPPARDSWMRAMDVLRDGDPFPHGRCWCGGVLDERGVCEDGASCARESWEQRQ
jgi:hypothetical protein